MSNDLTHSLGLDKSDARSKYMMTNKFNIAQTLDTETGLETGHCGIQYKLVEKNQRAKDPVPVDGSDPLHPIQ